MTGNHSSDDNGSRRRLSSANRRLLARIIGGDSDANIRFSDLRRLLLRLGFGERISGSHHIFTIKGIQGTINLQPARGLVKAYQVRQVRRFIEEYRIGEE